MRASRRLHRPWLYPPLTVEFAGRGSMTKLIELVLRAGQRRVDRARPPLPASSRRDSRRAT
jgi:hypothetical protein